MWRPEHHARYALAAYARMHFTKARQRLIAAGAIPPIDGVTLCVDCRVTPAQVYDHRDYRKPLEVEAVCRSCDRRRGPGEPSEHLVRYDARRRHAQQA